MIRINLLPIDKRRPERTPRPRFLLILSNVIVVCLIAVYLAWFFVIQLPQTNKNMDEANDKLNKLKAAVQEHTTLTANKNKLKIKIDQIKSVTGRRVDLWRTIDAIWTVVQKNPRIWLDDIAFLDAKSIAGSFRKANPRSRTAPEYAVELICHAAGDDASVMTQFRSDLRDEPFLRKHYPVMNNRPGWTVSAETGYIDSNSISFRILMHAEVKAPPAKKQRRRRR